MLDWAVLIMMSLLQEVNSMYKDKKAVLALEKQIQSETKDEFKKITYYYGRIERIAKSIVIYALLGFMIYATQTIEVNIINWVFFVLNNINMFLIIRGSKKESSINQSICVTNIIKAYSLFVMSLDILFICFIGMNEKDDSPGSLDQRFKLAYPGLYYHLDIIGLRTSETDTE